MHTKPPYQRTTVSGFSLTELMVVLMIFMILSLLSLPSILELYARQQAESYIQRFRQEMTYARVKAVSQGRDILVCPKASQVCDGQWSLSPIHITLLSSPPTLLATMTQLPTGHRLYYNREQLRFRNDGSLNALQNGTFVYCVRDYPWHFIVTMSQAGRSQLTFQQLSCPRPA